MLLVLLLLAQGVVAKAAPEALCPLAVATEQSLDTLISCPGWQTRPCRERDSQGRLRRSRSVRREFLRRYGYPKGRKGYVLDHLQPLALNGCDVGWNVQFQTIQDGKAKDRWERDVSPDHDEEAIQ